MRTLIVLSQGVVSISYQRYSLVSAPKIPHSSKACYDTHIVLSHCTQLDGGLYQGIASCFPPAYNPDSIRVEDSGKLMVLSELLHCLFSTTREKVVLVSNYTQVSDMV